MIDPVVTADGQTYEREAIEQWFSRKATSPLTGQPLQSTMLVPNAMARSLAREFAERYAQWLPECAEFLERVERARPGHQGHAVNREP